MWYSIRDWDPIFGRKARMKKTRNLTKKLREDENGNEIDVEQAPRVVDGDEDTAAYL